MIQVAVMGYGTIGSGVVEVLETNKKIIEQKVGVEVQVKAILDLREFPGTAIADKIVHDFSAIEKDTEISIVVEAMGGLNPAYPFVKACLEAGKHVTTSNKALVAAHGTELLKIARDHQVNFMFEASVGGGIPVIRPLYQCLGGEQIVEISGILNGTTNYILTKMDQEGSSFDIALKEAQELGYAERNPEADVEGHDTCRKIAILTALAAGKEVNYEKIKTQGITAITDIDFQYAKQLNRSIKLLGSSRISSEAAYISVEPVLLGKDHPLYAVSDVFNGIVVKGNMVGTTMFYGSGAGKLPTASAVVADIIEMALHQKETVCFGWSEETIEVKAADQEQYCYFLRVAGAPDHHQKQVKECFGDVQYVTLDGLDEYAIVTRLIDGQTLSVSSQKFTAFLNQVGSGGIRQTIRMN